MTEDLLPAAKPRVPRDNPWKRLPANTARRMLQAFDQRAMALGYPNALEAMQDLIDLHALAERLGYDDIEAAMRAAPRKEPKP